MNWFKKYWKSLSEPLPTPPAVKVNVTANPQPNSTPHAQQVLALAGKEAQRLHHKFVGTEHVLLGILALGQGVGYQVLAKSGLNLETLRIEMEKQMVPGSAENVSANPPFTPRVQKVWSLAEKEKRALGHQHLGTEHILLGLILEGAGVAARILAQLGVGPEQTRQAILRELDPDYSAGQTDDKASPNAGTTVTVRPELSPTPGPPDAPQAPTTVGKRFDVYCAERQGEVVVYRNALLKGVKRLFQNGQTDSMAQFLELEQADGQTIFISRFTVTKFCEPGANPGGEIIAGSPPKPPEQLT